MSLQFFPFHFTLMKIISLPFRLKVMHLPNELSISSVTCTPILPLQPRSVLTDKQLGAAIRLAESQTDDRRDKCELKCTSVYALSHSKILTIFRRGSSCHLSTSFARGTLRNIKNCNYSKLNFLLNKFVFVYLKIFLFSSFPITPPS